MYYPRLGKKSSDGGVEEKKDDHEPETLSPDYHYNHHHLHPQQYPSGTTINNTNGLHHRYVSSSSHQLSPQLHNNPYNSHIDGIPIMEGTNHHNPNQHTGINSANDSNKHRKNDEGLQGHFQNLLKSIIDSCESIVTFLVRGGEGGCPWPGGGGGGGTPTGAAGAGSPNHRQQHRSTAIAQPPLSITEELRKLAQSEGRVFGGGMRRADIPRFLGEEAVYSFDDDNISAISQHTLEEMTRHGIKHPVRRKLSSESSQSVSSLQQQQQQQQYPSFVTSQCQEREGPPSDRKIV